MNSKTETTALKNTGKAVRKRTNPKGDAAAPAAMEPTARRPTKAALLREMLAAPGGATLDALCQATGWQSHTVRAALTAVRKSGAEVERRREGGTTTYVITPGVTGE
jgi:hypothetical protein